MFTDYFELEGNPFGLGNDLLYFYTDGERFALLSKLLNHLQGDTHKPIVIVGQTGVGKSTLLSYVARHLPESVEYIQLADGSAAYLDKISALVSQLAKSTVNARKTVVAVNNAHEITEQDLLLLIVAVEQAPANVQMILSGLPGLQAQLKNLDPQLFAAENVFYYQVSAFNELQVSEYIQFRLQQAGYREGVKGELFSHDAMRRIARLSKGLPHAINLLAGASLLMASFDQRSQVTSETVDEAATSCLLPIDIPEYPVVDKPSQAWDAFSETALSAPVLKRKVPRRRSTNQRMQNWRRLEKRQSTPRREVLPSEVLNKQVANQDKHKRLARGVAIFASSLAFLIGVQYAQRGEDAAFLLSQVQPVTSGLMQLPNLQVSGETDNRPLSVAANVDYIALQVAEMETQVVRAHSNSPVKLAENVKQPVIVAKVNATQTGKMPEKAVAVVARNAATVFTAGEDAKQIALKTASLAKAVQAVKSQLEARRQQQTDVIQAQQVSANLPEISGRIDIQRHEIATVIDAQEAATRLRAANRLNLDKIGVEYGVESLMTAARTGNLHVLKLLLGGGVPADIKNKQGQTALMIAAQNGYKALVRELLNTGARPNLKDKQGKTALEYAEQNNRAEITNILVSYGAKG